MFKIIGCASAFAVEMTRRGRYGEVRLQRFLPALGAWKPAQNARFTHSHSDCDCVVPSFTKVQTRPESRGLLQILTQNRFLLLPVKVWAG